MKRSWRRGLAASALLLAAMSMAACTDSTPKQDDPAPAQSAPVPEESEQSLAPASKNPMEETPAPAAEGGAGAAAEWAAAFEPVGESLGSARIGDLEVDIRLAGIVPSPVDGSFVDPDTNELILAAGDEVAIIQYVVTNTGAPVTMNSLLLDTYTTYSDWKYMGPLVGTGSDKAFEAAGTTRGGADATKTVFPENGSPVYVLGTGESFAEAEDVIYQPGSPLEIRVAYVPANDDGSLDHEGRQEANVTVQLP